MLRMLPRSLALVCGLTMVASVAHSASPTTGSFDVTITIEEDCQLVSGPTLNFGTHGALSANVDQTTTIQVQCTAGTTYDIGLSAGANSADVAARRMIGSDTDTVTYSLFQGSCCSTVWGDTVGVDTVNATATGSAQDFSVYGRVPVQTTPPPDTYNDTVTVTMTF